MQTFKVEINPSARADIEELTDWIRGKLSLEEGDKYLNAMIGEVQSLSFFANLYKPSHYEDVCRYHPQACRMVSHNKKWIYIFHTEDDIVVVDRIRPAKLIKK